MVPAQVPAQAPTFGQYAGICIPPAYVSSGEIIAMTPVAKQIITVYSIADWKVNELRLSTQGKVKISEVPFT